MFSIYIINIIFFKKIVNTIKGNNFREIKKVCGSRLKAVHLAIQAILAGDAEVVVAGGMENMSSQKADELGIKPLVTIKANANAGVDPSIMGIGPVPAVKKLLKKHPYN